MWTFARGSENILITSETTGWKLQPVVSLRVITTYMTQFGVISLKTDGVEHSGTFMIKKKKEAVHG